MQPIHLHHVWDYNDVDRAFWADHLAPWLPQEIFDAHTHVTEPRFRLEPITEEKRRQYWVNEVAEPIGAADAKRCYETVFPGRDFSCVVFGDPLLELDIEANNVHLHDRCVEYGWYHLTVALPQWSAERLAQELDRPRTIGAKVYYNLIGRDPTSRDKYLEASIFEFLPPHQLEVLNDRHAWLTLHVPKAGRLMHPDNIREVREIRRRYPNVHLVIAHLGRCYTPPHAQEALPQLADDEGLLFDISAVFHPEVLQYAIETLGPSRLLYGVDNPVFYMRGRQQWRGSDYVYRTNYPFHFNRDREPPEAEAQYTLTMYESLRALKQACEATHLSREQIECIFSKNARRTIETIPKPSILRT